MIVGFRCPNCEQANRCEAAADAECLACAHCPTKLPIPQGAWNGESLTRCLACPSTELYVRKGFPPRMGVAIVASSFAAALVAVYLRELYWFYGILFGVFIVDAILYATLGNSLVCYRCGAVYRRAGDLSRHVPFALETHEKYRQQAARLAQASAERQHSTQAVAAPGEPISPARPPGN